MGAFLSFSAGRDKENSPVVESVFVSEENEETTRNKMISDGNDEKENLSPIEEEEEGEFIQKEEVEKFLEKLKIPEEEEPLNGGKIKETHEKVLDLCNTKVTKIMVIGKFGSGKSCFVRKTFPDVNLNIVSHSFARGTDSINEYSGNNLIITDCPGFEEDNKKNEILWKRIIEYLTGRGKDVSVVIYCISVLGNRLDTNLVSNIKKKMIEIKKPLKFIITHTDVLRLNLQKGRVDILKDTIASQEFDEESIYAISNCCESCENVCEEIHEKSVSICKKTRLPTFEKGKENSVNEFSLLLRDIPSWNVFSFLDVINLYKNKKFKAQYYRNLDNISIRGRILLAIPIVLAAVSLNTVVGAVSYFGSDLPVLVGVQLVLTFILAFIFGLKITESRKFVKAAVFSVLKTMLFGFTSSLVVLVFLLALPLGKIISTALKTTVAGIPAGIAIDAAVAGVITAIYGILLIISFSVLSLLPVDILNNDPKKTSQVIDGERFFEAIFKPTVKKISFEDIKNLASLVHTKNKKELGNFINKKKDEISEDIKRSGVKRGDIFKAVDSDRKITISNNRTELDLFLDENLDEGYMNSPIEEDEELEGEN